MHWKFARRSVGRLPRRGNEHCAWQRRILGANEAPRADHLEGTSIASTLTRKAHRSAASSMILAVGLPAPWPAFVSMRIRIGLSPALRRLQGRRQI